LFDDGGDDLPFTEITDGSRQILPEFLTPAIFPDPNDPSQVSPNPQFPVWVFPDGSQAVGLQTLQTLAERTFGPGATLPLNADQRPTFEPVPDQTVRFNEPVHVPIDGYDPEGGPLTISVSVADPSLLEATVLQNNRSVRLDMVGYDDMVFELFEQRAPNASGRIATLVNQGFYDGIIFHRVDDGFVLQAGDPNGTGVGGSSLGSFDDDFHPDLRHTSTGVLSFAKTTDDTNNSQFFITETSTPWLDFNHSVFGILTEGEEVREAISGVDVDGDDKPLIDVVINSAELFEDTENGVLMLKALATSGSTDVTVTITDEDNNSFSRTFSVDLAATANNGQPYLLPLASDPVFTAGANGTIQLQSLDVDGDPVQYGILTQSPDVSASINATTGEITIDPGTFVGTTSITVGVAAVSGQGSNLDSQEIPVTFTNSTTVNAPASLDLLATSDTGAEDDDNITNAGTMTFRVGGVTSGALVQIVDTSSGTVVGTGTATGSSIEIQTTELAALGDDTYVLAARQQSGGVTSTLSPTLTLTLDRSQPTITRSSVELDANVDTPYTSNVVSNEEVNGVTYRLINSPSGATITSNTGVISWTPTSSQEGENSLTVQVEDRAGNVRDETFTITVRGEPVAGIRLEITDLSGNVISQVNPGDEFLLRMYGVDNRLPSQRTGIFGAYADIVFDGSLVRAIPGSVDQSLRFINTPKGTINIDEIDELGAFIGLTQPTFEQESLISTVRF
ncbi:MAG: peptidylprolyl isomerase, partial [Planctomycetota bacterium]